MTVVAYVAGPFRADTAWGIAENVRNAERVGLAVARAGAMPLIPHANTAHFHGEGEDALWLAGTMELLRRCDCVVLVPGWERSSGTRAEVEEANRLGLPVIVFEDEVALRDAFTAIGAGSVQWSRYVGERMRAVAASARTAQKIGINSVGEITDPDVDRVTVRMHKATTRPIVFLSAAAVALAAAE